MSENKAFDEIMSEITSGFTGDSDEDFTYLGEKCEEYRDHEMAQEILRECGRLMFDLLSDDDKDELTKVIDNKLASTEAVLDEIRAHIQNNEYDKALEMIEELVEIVEAENRFQDDMVSEYHEFNEIFEEVLYSHIYEPTKELRYAQIPYTEIYSLYGSLLIELNRLEEAREALLKGLRWNPMCFHIMSEYTETFKIEGNMDMFFEKTLEAFKIAIHAPQVARCFRNLGYYFVEKKLYKEAAAVYLLSLGFEPESIMAQSELDYIQQVAGSVEEPTYEDIKEYAEKYGFPVGADDAVVGYAYSYGEHFAEQGENEPARYFLSIVYELTQDDEVKKMLDAIPE